MKMHVKIIISIIAIVVSAIIARKKAKKGKSFMLAILIGVAISAGVFVYPIFHETTNIIEKGINTLVYIIQACLFSSDITLVQSERVGNDFVQILVCLELLCLPLLTAGTALEILQRYFGKVKLFCARNANLHVFSNINETSQKIAELIKKENPKDKIVFCKIGKDEKTFLNNYKNILVKNDIVSLKLKTGKRKIKFYVKAEDEEKTLEETIALVEKYKKQNCEVLCFTSNEESKMILDEMEKGEVIVNVIDEIQNSIYHLLTNHPLYENAKNNKIKVLIVGLGTVGKEVFKSILWCGQIPKYTLEINAVEKNEEQIKEVAFECPEIFKNAQQYNLNCYSNDIRDIEINPDIQEQIKGTNYIVIATGDEENNIKIAKILSRFFLKEDENEPQIFIWMEESIKKDKIVKIKNPYIFKTFGNSKEIYELIEQNSELEKMAIRLHLSFDETDTNLKRYNQREYNKKSSRAMALHLKYKLHPYIQNNEKAEILSDTQILKEIAESEHKRWLTYLRTEGYQFASENATNKYFSKTGKIKEHFLKLHPALVEWNMLEQAQKTISKVENQPEKNLQQSTIQSVINMIKNLEVRKDNV